MSRPPELFRSRAWPRVAVLALVGLIAAGCSDSARFAPGPYGYNRAPPPDVTGSIARRPPPPERRIASRPLPAPSQPTTVAARPGYADGAQGLAAYRPNERRAEITGSVPAHRAAPPAPTGHWSWDGGSPVTVRRGQTLETIARQYHVPVSAIMTVNHVSSSSQLWPGRHLVIPHYVRDHAPRVAAVASAPPPPRPAPRVARRGEDVHIVRPGETLIGIARQHGMSLAALARVNHISPFTKLNIGDRVMVPAGGRRLAEHRTPAPRVTHVARAPRVTRPRTVVATRTVASAPTQNVRMAKADIHEPKSVTKTAEPVGGIPTFRWPVHGRIIASFGPKPNGARNDGINLAVPEGTPIKAADGGVVAYAGNELKGYGNLVLIRHADGFVSAYANASKLLVKRGDTVKRGQVIALAGQTGNVNSPQLHFEIRKGSLPVDPTKYLSGA